ncbi:hypothetical protein H6P81_011154 [Aristolochia fimbriata]|uniref:Uncharacterized protein n=1 Tax=Aristolochia fimbriata TaxID=158543 RepID=A0AAV7ERH5_ARIFI|nr:hypothetical protein H6P81_011154 [Aristolochia fimbriata]
MEKGHSSGDAPLSPMHLIRSRPPLLPDIEKVVESSAESKTGKGPREKKGRDQRWVTTLRKKILVQKGRRRVLLRLSTSTTPAIMFIFLCPRFFAASASIPRARTPQTQNDDPPVIAPAARRPTRPPVNPGRGGQTN